MIEFLLDFEKGVLSTYKSIHFLINNLMPTKYYLQRKSNELFQKNHDYYMFFKHFY